MSAQAQWVTSLILIVYALSVLRVAYRSKK